MRETFAGLSYDFLFSKLHGMWAQALAGDRLLKLVQGHRTQDLGRALSPLGVDVSNRAEVQKDLTRHLIDVLAGIRRLLDKRTGAFYARLIERYFFENLKTVLHYYYFPEQEVAIEFLLIDSPHLPHMDVDALLAAGHINKFFNRLPAHELNPDLLPILVALDDTRDIFVAESKLDQLYFAGLCSDTRRLPLAIRGIATELAGTEIDVNNLVTIMRNAHLYGLAAEDVAALCIAGGFVLDQTLCLRIAQAADENAMSDMVPPEYARILRPLAANELYVREHALWNHLYRRAHSAFADYDAPALSVIAFPFLKRFEVLNINRVFEGCHFGLEADEIDSMMIGVSHV